MERVLIASSDLVVESIQVGCGRYAIVVACGRASFGRRSLNDFFINQTFSSNDSLSLIHAGEWRLRDCRLDKHSL
jgi:hypothetical protein